MTPDILIRAGDRLPVLRRTLELDGVPVNLSAATGVVFKAQGATGVVITGACATVDATGGVVDYSWTSNDALVPAGFYAAWYEVTYSGGQLTVPNTGYLALQISSVAQGTWTYSGNPASSPRDTVRYYLQDTDPDDPQMSDAELDFLIQDWYSVTASYILVAATAAEILSVRYSGEVTVSSDAVIVALEQLQEKWAATAARLRAMQARKDVGAPDAGDIDLYEINDPSIKPLSFDKGMHDNRWAGRQDYGGDLPDPVSPLYGDPGGWW